MYIVQQVYIVQQMYMGQQVVHGTTSCTLYSKAFKSFQIPKYNLILSSLIKKRMLTQAVFEKYKKVWLTGKKISLDRKLRLYDAQVLSVLLYNANSWSPTKATMEKIDTLHRRHLRTILNIKGWPNGQISNITLYSRCNVTKLSERIHHKRYLFFIFYSFSL